MTQPEDLALSPRVSDYELDPEAPENDAIEQAMIIDPDPGFDEPTLSDSVEAPEWDALEQATPVQLDDDYR